MDNENNQQQNPEVSFQSSDIGVKTAVKTNDLVNVKQDTKFQKFLKNRKIAFKNFKSDLKSPEKSKKFYLKISLISLFSILLIIGVTFGFILVIKQATVKTPPKPITAQENYEKITKITKDISNNITSKSTEELLKPLQEQLKQIEKQNDHKKSNEMKFYSASQLARLGLYTDALAIIETINENELTTNQKYNIYKVAIDIAAKANNYEIQEKYQKALEELPPMQHFGGGA